jgi:hypothetical protein
MGLDLTDLEIALDDADAQPSPESSTEPAKTAASFSPRLRKRFMLVTKPVSFVDVIV